MFSLNGSTRRLRRGVLTAAVAVAAAIIPATGALAAPSAGPHAAAARPAASAPATHRTARGTHGTARGTHGGTHPTTRRVCGQPRPGYMACQSITRTNVPAHRGLLRSGVAPSGYGPANLRSAYELPSATAGKGATVAIVDAYDDPDAASDLAVYRKQYGLPPCTTASGCFRKVAQNGSSNYPEPNGDWAEEISLDLDMVSAICPNCHILLVEANNNSDTNLGASVDEAVALGAKYVSNSWSGPESGNELDLDKDYFDHPGVVETAASGDTGYGPNYPATSPYVTSVGGTTLTRDSSVSRGWTETAWSGGGSGCSVFEPKPAWQTDSGCAHRTAVDVSADANPSPGVAIYDTATVDLGVFQGWNVVGGTSVATPIIASTYALAGQPFAGSNPVSYPYADPSALHDVTSGSNSSTGCTPAYLCTAGPGYDGPTGLGTPDGTAAFTRPHGTLSGTITDAATGKPLAGALVQAGTGYAHSNASGHYSLELPAGSYSLSALDFSGYATRQQSGVTVASGQAVTRNFALKAAPDVTLSGTVKDGSIRRWPLYAKVSLAGLPVSTYTNPATGRYRLRVPQGSTFSVQASPVYAGYQQATHSLTVAASSLTQDFSVPVTGFTCSAPGYPLGASLMSQPFTAKKIPSGWHVTTGTGALGTWAFNDPVDAPNWTPGGSGNFAVAYAQTAGNFDTELISSPMNLSADRYPILRFDSFSQYSGGEEAIDVSTDGGKTWTNEWSNTDAYLGNRYELPLPAAAGQRSVEVRFRWYGYNVNYANVFWEIDNVSIAGCGTGPAGLVVGRVSDANTGQGVDGATVASQARPGQSDSTVPTPVEPKSASGLYWETTTLHGSQRFTATARGYAPKTSSIDVTPGRLAQANFTLDAGRLAAAPESITASTAMGQRATATFTVRNTGSAPARLGITSEPGGFTQAGPQAGAAPQAGTRAGAGPQAGSVPLERIHGHFSPLVILPSHTLAGRLAPAPPSAQWTQAGYYPVATGDLAAAADPVTGRVYAVGEGKGYLYDPATSRWTALPAGGPVRDAGVAGVIDGRLYTAGGYSDSGAPVPGMSIYDPASGQWTAGAAIPHSYFGSASAVLDGNMYVVGGCNVSLNECGENAVQVYNPATNTWRQAAPYPAGVGWLGCGAIGGRLYCAGGTSSATGTTSAAYSYNPGRNSWSPIESLPVGVWGSAASAADGELLLSSGVTAGNQYGTNQAYGYNTVTRKWRRLPNSPNAAFRTSGACGFYQIGGYVGVTDLGQFIPSSSVDQLPGYGDCGGDPWLSASPATTTLAPGQSTKITVTLNAASPSVSQPGSYTAALRLGGNTPYPVQTVPVTLTVTPRKTWGKISGTVSGRGCSGRTKPLPGATVQVTSAGGAWPLATDRDGRYSLWLDASNDPLTVIVTDPGWLSQSAKVTIKALASTAHDVTLTPAGQCGRPKG